MANYYGTGRTNWFKVKDAEAFKADMANYDVEVGEDVQAHEQVFALFGQSEEGMPSSVYDEDTEDWEEIVWQDAIGKHLADEWVCVMMGIGNEKMRYLGGHSLAFNNKGEEHFISLDDIYTKAKDLGKNMSVN